MDDPSEDGGARPATIEAADEVGRLQTESSSGSESDSSSLISLSSMQGYGKVDVVSSIGEGAPTSDVSALSSSKPTPESIRKLTRTSSRPSGLRSVGSKYSMALAEARESTQLRLARQASVKLIQQHGVNGQQVPKLPEKPSHIDGEQADRSQPARPAPAWPRKRIPIEFTVSALKGFRQAQQRRNEAIQQSSSPTNEHHEEEANSEPTPYATGLPSSSVLQSPKPGRAAPSTAAPSTAAAHPPSDWRSRPEPQPQPGAPGTVRALAVVQPSVEDAVSAKDQSVRVDGLRSEEGVGGVAPAPTWEELHQSATAIARKLDTEPIPDVPDASSPDPSDDPVPMRQEQVGDALWDIEQQLAQDADALSVNTADSEAHEMDHTRYLKLCDAVEDSLHSGTLGVGDLLEWKDFVLSIHVLPVSAQLRLVTVLGKLLRCYTTLQQQVSTCLQALRLFATDVLASAEVQSLRRLLQQQHMEANLYRMRALESERKLRLAMVQVRRLEGVRSMFRWQRIVLQLMHKGIKRSSRRKLRVMQDHLGRVKRVNVHLKAKSKQALALAAAISDPHSSPLANAASFSLASVQTGTGVDLSVWRSPASVAGRGGRSSQASSRMEPEDFGGSSPQWERSLSRQQSWHSTRGRRSPTMGDSPSALPLQTRSQQPTHGTTVGPRPVPAPQQRDVPRVRRSLEATRQGDSQSLSPRRNPPPFSRKRSLQSVLNDTPLQDVLANLAPRAKRDFDLIVLAAARRLLESTSAADTESLAPSPTSVISAVTDFPDPDIDVGFTPSGHIPKLSSPLQAASQRTLSDRHLPASVLQTATVPRRHQGRGGASPARVTSAARVGHTAMRGSPIADAGAADPQAERRKRGVKPVKRRGRTTTMTARGSSETNVRPWRPHLSDGSDGLGGGTGPVQDSQGSMASSQSSIGSKTSVQAVASLRDQAPDPLTLGARSIDFAVARLQRDRNRESPQRAFLRASRSKPDTSPRILSDTSAVDASDQLPVLPQDKMASNEIMTPAEPGSSDGNHSPHSGAGQQASTSQSDHAQALQPEWTGPGNVKPSDEGLKSVSSTHQGEHQRQESDHTLGRRATAATGHLSKTARDRQSASPPHTLTGSRLQAPHAVHASPMRHTAMLAEVQFGRRDQRGQGSEQQPLSPVQGVGRHVYSTSGTASGVTVPEQLRAAPPRQHEFAVGNDGMAADSRARAGSVESTDAGHVRASRSSVSPRQEYGTTLRGLPDPSQAAPKPSYPFRSIAQYIVDSVGREKGGKTVAPRRSSTGATEGSATEAESGTAGKPARVSAAGAAALHSLEHSRKLSQTTLDPDQLFPDPTQRRLSNFGERRGSQEYVDGVERDGISEAKPPAEVKTVHLALDESLRVSPIAMLTFRLQKDTAQAKLKSAALAKRYAGARAGAGRRGSLTDVVGQSSSVGDHSQAISLATAYDSLDSLEWPELSPSASIGPDTDSDGSDAGIAAVTAPPRKENEVRSATELDGGGDGMWRASQQRS